MFVVFIIAVEVLMILTMYSFPYVASGVGYDEALVLYTYVFMGLGVISTVIFSSVCISSEKEAQTWSILLMTPLSDWQILSGKFIGILRRCLPIWITLIIYFCPFLFSFTFGSGILSLFLLSMLIFAMIVFLYGAGIYFSSRFKDTTAAFIAFFTLLLVIWFIIPLICDINFPGNYLRYFSLKSFGETFMSINPFILARIILTLDLSHAYKSMRWPDQSRDAFESIILMICIETAYIIAGLVFAWRAKCCFRKKII